MNKVDNAEAGFSRRMGEAPIPKLLITMSLPMVVSMLIQALYNVVDSIFVSMISENALTAVSLAFPIQHLIIALGTGTGVGLGALLSRSLGRGDKKATGKIAANGVLLILLSYVIFALIGLFFSTSFFAVQTDNQEIVQMGSDYVFYICLFSFGAFGQFIFEKMLQATGRTVLSMVTQGVGAVINLVLDPIFIFGPGGFPALGVKGAAIATVIGQIVAALLALVFCVRKNREIPLRGISFSPSIIKQVYVIGSGSIAMMALSSVMNFGMNRLLLGFSTTASAVFGIYYKLQSFIFMPIYGLNGSIVPIMSYNYGAGNKRRMKQTVRYGIFYTLLYMVICMAAMLLFSITWL